MQVDRDLREMDRQTRQDSLASSARWNFDFDKEVPLDGSFDWQRCQDAPQFYAPKVRIIVDWFMTAAYTDVTIVLQEVSNSKKRKRSPSPDDDDEDEEEKVEAHSSKRPPAKRSTALPILVKSHQHQSSDRPIVVPIPALATPKISSDSRSTSHPPSSSTAQRSHSSNSSANASSSRKSSQSKGPSSKEESGTQPPPPPPNSSSNSGRPTSNQDLLSTKYFR